MVQHGGPASRTIMRVWKRSTLHAGHAVQKWELGGWLEESAPHAVLAPHTHSPPAYRSWKGISFSVAHDIGFSVEKLVVSILYEWEDVIL